MRHRTEEALVRRREELKALFNERVEIARSMGMRLDFTEDSRSVVTMPFNPGFNNGLDVVHGGVYMTLLDTAGWFASAVTHETGSSIVTSEFSIRFLGAASRTDLKATGRVVKSGRRQDVVEVYLTDGAGKNVGHGIGTFSILG